MRQVLARISDLAPVPVFPVVAADAVDAVRALRLHPEIELVSTPRHAHVLLVAGGFPPGEVPALFGVHDQIPPPRATVRWRGESLQGFPRVTTVTGDERVLVDSLVALDREITADPTSSEAPLLPDVDLVEWRGVGPYGHGGKGMTGGTPYGRPMTERADDRDGLTLDQLPVTIGPWIGPLPPGIWLRVELQGDVIQEVKAGVVASAPRPPDIFTRATSTPQPLADVELARVRHHLRWLSDSLEIHGLPALGRRSLSLAEAAGIPRQAEVERLLAMVRRSGIFRLALRGVGVLDGSVPNGLGPVTRAAGRDDDVRSADPAYRDLGFVSVVQVEGDAAARWRQRMAEITQSLDLVTRAGDALAFGSGVVEGPRGSVESAENRVSASMLQLMPRLLSGMEWGDAVSAIWSLDLDPGLAVPVRTSG